MENIIPFAKLSLKDIKRVGGKNASLGEMIQHLTKADVKVPDGFAITTDAYQQFISQNGLDKKIYRELNALNVADMRALKKTSAKIRHWILATPLPTKLEQDIAKAYAHIKSPTVAVRSSATSEDLPEGSFAGQAETFLNIRDIKHVLQAVKAVFASLFTARSLVYRHHHHLKPEHVAISVGVQQMVRSDKGASGVMFTLDTESGFDKVIFINASYGLGETLVQGKVNPDEYYVYKPMLQTGKKAILRKNLGDKAIKMIYSNKKQHHHSIKTVNVKEKERLHFCLSDTDIMQLARYGLAIEKHYARPMDVEWAKDGVNGQLYILQARAETVKSRDNKQFVERYRLTEKGKIKTTGRSVGQKIGQGNARVIVDSKKMHDMRAGEVLITEMTDPDWEPVMKLASAIVTNRGGRTCHAAIVARELGIPAVVGCGNATTRIKQAEPITVSCASGETGKVYQGLLKYKIDKVSVKDMPKLPFKLCLNLGNPDKAFSYQFIPNDGVGLARLEFIIGDMIGIHPNAVLKFNALPKKLKQVIKQRTAAYASPLEFYLSKLAEGIATIAAAFYPKQVIFRFSDFKSNEYANLLGGTAFEPKEENPMIGFRGASRYAGDNFRDCFELECKAFKRVREELGLTNAQVMIPFVRTVNELKKIINLIESFGLKNKNGDLKIFMMCEIPSNALLAKDFLSYVDGFSIGSNDLTQLTLGLDRDSNLVASLFDERDAAVKILLHEAIVACNKAGKYVGICGQAPSDHPEIAKWLADEGIQSISLTPDSIVETWLYLAKQPKH